MLGADLVLRGAGAERRFDVFRRRGGAAPAAAGSQPAERRNAASRLDMVSGQTNAGQRLDCVADPHAIPYGSLSATEARLKIEQASLGAPPKVENQLGLRIERLLLADADGNHFRCESISAMGARTLEAASLADEGAWFRQFYNRRHPAVPPGFDRTMTRFMSGRVYRWTSPWNNPLPPAALRTGILERELEAAMLQLSRMQGSAPAGLRPRSYLAIVERSPEVEYGVDAYDERRKLARDRWEMVRQAMIDSRPMIELRHLHRCFGATRAGERRHLRGRPGQVFGYIGPNGAGKTTSMRILATLDLPDAGRRPGRRLLGRRRSRPRPPPAGIHARLFRHLRQRQRARVSRLLRPGLRLARRERHAGDRAT